MNYKKNIFLLLVVLFLSCLLLIYGESGIGFVPEIVWELRLPKVIIAFFAGGLLSIAGFLMQLYFQNPIAGPDILGVSSGSILMVAIGTLLGGTFPLSFMRFGLGALSFVGAMSVFFLLMYYLEKNQSKVTLIILGVLISSFVSGLISVMYNASEALRIKSYLLWTQGSFRNVLSEDLPLLIFVSFVSLLPLIYFQKNLNQMILGEKYAHSMGVNIKRMRRIFMILSSLYVSIVTIYCGPISFIGIIAPFLSKRYLKKSSLQALLPASFLMGATIALGAELILVSFSYLPLSLNAVLGFFGAPLLAYYLYQQSPKGEVL